MDKLEALIPWLIMSVVAVLFIRWSRAGLKRYSEQKSRGQNPPRPILYYILGWVGTGWAILLVLVLLAVLLG